MKKLILVSAVAGAVCFSAGFAFAVSQPHMETALSDLQTARDELVAADQFHDHGGHAGNATQLVDQAIHEVHEGIRFRNEH